MKFCSQCQLLFPDHTQFCPEDAVALRFVEDVEPGMVIRSKYRIVAKIGVGGMASVFRARHELLNEDRAIKLVLPKYSNDKDFLKRFRHEAAVARKLRHENAVSVEDLDQIEDGRPFMVMELLQGRDLRSLILREGPLSVERTLALSAQIASALSAAHELGIVHRDIKPDNVFVTADKSGKETAKVLDFGIAKALEGVLDGVGYTATKTGLIVGTPQYISPEQAMGLGSSKLDGRADIYSLGIVIYEMLTGRLPFESDTPMGMVLHHLNTKPQPPHELRPELHIPRAVSLVLMKALEKDPAKRFQTAKELVDALRQPEAWVTTKFGIEAAASRQKLVVPATQMISAPPVQDRMAAAAAAKPAKAEEPSIEVHSPQKISPRKWFLWAALPVAALLVVAIFVFFTSGNHDAAIRDEITRRLQESSIDSFRRGSVRAVVNHGDVTLEGQVATAQEKDSANDLAKSIDGVNNVVNKMELKSTVATVPSGQGIQSARDDFDEVVPNRAASVPSGQAIQPAATQSPAPQTNRSDSGPVNLQPQQQARTQPTPRNHLAPQTPAVPPAITNQVNALANSTRTAAVRKTLDLANSQRDAGHYRDAIKIYNDVLKLDPNNAEAKAGLAKAQQAAEWEVSN